MNANFRNNPPFLLSPFSTAFPNPNLALQEPDGLLAVGGDLSPTRLLNAYRNGIFPWFSDDQPILWWSPDPRSVLYPDQLQVSRSLRKVINQRRFEFTIDQAFGQVMTACAAPRRDCTETWITREMYDTYCELHRQGHAHSAECWQDGRLVGGLYGVAIGQVFFGESMFAQASNASKVAFAQLVARLIQWDYQLIDCQVHTDHLESLGAIDIPRASFLQQLQTLYQRQPHPLAWQQED